MCDALQWLRLTVRSNRSTKAKNLFLRRQLGLYIERGIEPRRINPVTRLPLVLLSGLFDWRGALVVVRPETLLRWHYSAWKLLWRLKCRPGVPVELLRLIRRMALENPRWGEERMANELLLKLDIEISPAHGAQVHAPASSRAPPRESALVDVSAFTPSGNPRL